MLAPLDTRTNLSPLQRARVDQLFAAVYSQTGRDDEALVRAARAAREAKAINAYDLLARIATVPGMICVYRGRPQEALKYLNECLAWAQKSKQPPLIAGAYIRLASAYQDMGDWTHALDAVNRAFDADRNASDAARVQYLTRRGMVQAELHDADAAKADITEALALARKIGDKRGEAQVLGDLARTCQRFGDPKAAAAYAAQSVAIAREIHVPTMEISALNQLASIQRDAGQLHDARANLDAAIALIARYKEHRDEPYVLKNLGEVLNDLHMPAEAEEVLDRAAARADEDNLTRIRWIARVELAQMHAANAPDTARKEFEDALAILEEQQTNVLLEGFRAGALDQTLAEFDPYERYIAFLLDHGDPATAFYVAERERARAFLDTLSTRRDALARDVPGSFSNAERDLLTKIKTAQALLRTAELTDAKRADLVSAVAKSESELTKLRLRLAIDHAAVAHARYPKLFQVADVQRRLLGTDESLLAFYVGREQSTAWVVTRHRVATFTLPPAAELERDVTAALGELRDPAARKWPAVAELSRALSIDAIAREVRRARLIVVPHGCLNDVPFEALSDKTGRMLVERFAISYTPSASSLAFLRSLPERKPAEVSLLAIANPVVAPERMARFRNVDLAHINLLEPVPHTLDEVHAIAKLFGRSAEILEGPQATRSEMSARGIDQTQILHFATHGLIDEDHPERSGLVLTADPPRDDGLLQMRDIYALHLRADLVTLSACETALGKQATGEGIIGLTRAFFYAGARSVVASLWDVEDNATARLMDHFYANLRAGQPIDIALQHAKIDFIRGGGPAASPFYWASFIASGNTRARIHIERTSPVAPAAVAALGIIAAAAYWRTRKARRGDDATA